MNHFVSQYLSSILIDRSNGHRKKVRAKFSAKQKFDHLDVNSRYHWQSENLAKLLNHARLTVPYYRDRLAGSESITAQNAREILQSLPVIGRADIQRQPEAFRSTSSDIYPDATGGSSGTPMRFWVDRETQQSRESSLYWADHLAGWHYGERIAMLWGSDKDIKSASQELRSAFRWWVDNRRWYNAFNMGEARMDMFHKAMTRFKPHIMVAYAGSMEVYARYLNTQRIRPTYPLRSIICSAEVLTLSARETIEQVFEKPVFNRYGNREFGAIAAECKVHSGLHINEQDMLLEIESSEPKEIAGNVVITYFNNLAMPFIRYNTGDMARLHPSSTCSCGGETMRLAGIVGRESDSIRTRNGNLIHGEYFTHMLYSARNVREFQFVQVSLDEYRLLLVADRKESAELEQAMKYAMLERVGETSKVDIQYVDCIPLTTSGKRKFTISLVK